MFLHYILQTLFLITGITAMSASFFNWDWFFNTENATPIVKHFGRTKSRWIYGITGLIFVIAAIGFYYKISHLTN